MSSFSDILNYENNVESIICPIGYSLTVTEVMIDLSSGNYCIEFLNTGPAINTT